MLNKKIQVVVPREKSNPAIEFFDEILLKNQEDFFAKPYKYNKPKVYFGL